MHGHWQVVWAPYIQLTTLRGALTCSSEWQNPGRDWSQQVSRGLLNDWDASTAVLIVHIAHGTWETSRKGQADGSRAHCWNIHHRIQVSTQRYCHLHHLAILTATVSTPSFLLLFALGLYSCNAALYRNLLNPFQAGNGYQHPLPSLSCASWGLQMRAICSPYYLWRWKGA